MLPASPVPVLQTAALVRVVGVAAAVLVGGAYLLGSLQRFLGGGRRARGRTAPATPPFRGGGVVSEENIPFAPPSNELGPGAASSAPRGSARRGPSGPRPPAAHPPRTAPALGGWVPLLLGDGAAVACLRWQVGATGLRAAVTVLLLGEALTLCAFVPWAARHRAWHAADYAHFLTLLPGAVAARLRGSPPERHRAAFAAGAADRRLASEERAWAAAAAWRVDEALRRHSPGYAASGARIEAARAADGTRELRLRFPGGVPDAAAESAFREHAASGLLARAAGASSEHGSSVELPDGTLALRLRPPDAAPLEAAPPMAGDDGAAAVGDGGAATASDDASPLGPGLPPLSLLAPAPPPPGAEDGAAIARRVMDALRAQGIGDAALAGVRVGPTVTTVIVRPPAGPGAARILRLAEDLRFRLGLSGVMVRRAEGWPGCAAIEVPNARRATVALRAVLVALRDAGGEMAAPLGVATDGTPAAADIADWPHGLVAGATGAGKSVFVNAVLVSMLLRYSPRRLRLVLIDPKRVEFSLYRGLPHLARPIVVGTDEAVTALEDAVAEMHRRYAALERAGARKLSEYNALAPEDQRLPRLLIVIDEAQALMADKEMAAAVVAASKALAAMGRAAGVHMLYGTQYPLATVIPSALKANTPTRVALLVPSRVNSQVILDQDGAEALLGAGDMLVCVGGGAEVRRLQSAFVSEEDVRAVVAWWKGHADGGDDGGAAADDGAPPAPSPVPSAREEASRLLRALAGEVTAQADALAGAHIAFVRPGELVAVRRDHVERVLRRLDAEPGAVLDQWKAAGWIRCDGDRYTAQVRTPWSSRARMVLVVWDAVRPDDGR